MEKVFFQLGISMKSKAMQWQLPRSVQSLHVPLHLNSAIELSLLSFDVQNCFHLF